jgi:hypothetical protein
MNLASSSYYYKPKGDGDARALLDGQLKLCAARVPLSRERRSPKTLESARYQPRR